MKKALRIISLVVVFGAIFAAAIISMNHKTPNSEKIWDDKMVMGNIDAENYYIIYSDLACPYCIIFENAIVENEEDFKHYIEENDILVEVRLSDFLYEYGAHEAPASRLGAIATYCARDEGKFWDYYNLAISTIWNDFFKDNMSTGFTYLNQTDNNYWLKIGKQVGLGSEFEDCVNSKKPLEEIIEIAAKTTKYVDGMPFFKFNNYTFSGFNPNGNYDDVMKHLNAGLKK